MANPNAVKVYNDLRSLGLSVGAAEGVVGNLVAESSVNPKAVQPGGPGRGIAQWSVGQRWDQLVAAARQAGKDPWDLQTQEAFMVTEMMRMGVWAQLKQTSDPLTAATIVMRRYEMPKDQSAANANHRAGLGVQAVGTHTGDPVTAVGNWAGSVLANPGGAVSSAAGSVESALASALTAPFQALGSAISGAEQSAVQGAQHIVLVGVFVALGVGLVGAGVWKATGGYRAKVREEAEKAAPLVAAAA